MIHSHPLYLKMTSFPVNGTATNEFKTTAAQDFNNTHAFNAVGNMTARCTCIESGVLLSEPIFWGTTILLDLVLFSFVSIIAFFFKTICDRQHKKEQSAKDVFDEEMDERVEKKKKKKKTGMQKQQMKTCDKEKNWNSEDENVELEINSTMFDTIDTTGCDQTQIPHIELPILSSARTGDYGKLSGAKMQMQSLDALRADALYTIHASKASHGTKYESKSSLDLKHDLKQEDGEDTVN
jgi:hypothetical protein